MSAFIAHQMPASAASVVAAPVGFLEEGEPAVRIFVYAHGGLDVVVAVALRRDLQGQALPLDAVVTPDLAVFLDAEPVLERSADVRNESRSRLGGGHGERGVVLRHEPRLR
jgi:hypothetical protein